MNETWNEPGCWLLPPPPPPGGRLGMEVEAVGDVPGFMEGRKEEGRDTLVQVIAQGRSKGIRDKVADWMDRRMQ